MYHGNSLAESLNEYSRINGIAAGRSVGLRWKEQLRTMYEAANPQEKIAIVVVLDGIDDFLIGNRPIEPSAYEERRLAKRLNQRPRRHSWVNTLFRSV